MEKIRQHILDQARDEARAIVGAAREAAERRLAAARERIARELDSRLNHMKTELERDRRRALDRLASEYRLQALRRKREIIDEVFARAQAQFVQTPRYRHWLEGRLASAADLAGEVLCHERDRALCRAALQYAADQGKAGLTLAEPAQAGAGADRKDLAGGIIVRTEHFDLDLSLESAFDDLRTRVMPEFIALAFAGLEESTSGGP